MDRHRNITAQYQALQERIRRYSMTEAARARVLAELERIYRADLQAARALGTVSGIRSMSTR
jgi:hypothetical protein